MMKPSSPGLDNLAAGAGIGLAGRFIGRFLNVLENIIAARLLGPGAFGLYALGLTVFRLAELIAPLGFDIGVVKYGAEYNVSGNRPLFKGIVTSSLIGSFVFSGLLGFSIYQFSPWLAMDVFNDQRLVAVFQLFAMAFPLSGLLLILSAIIRTTDTIKYSVIVQDLVQPLLALALLAAFAFAGLNANRLVVADLASYLLAVLLATYFLWILFPYLFKKETGSAFPKREYFLFSMTSCAAVFLSAMVFWIDRLFVGYYLSTSDLGIYQSALQMAVIFAVIMSALSRTLVPIFSTLHAEGKFGELEEAFRIGTKWGFFISLPLVLLIFLNPAMLLEALYGGAYSLGGNILVVLLLGQLTNLATGAVGPLLLVGGHQKIVLLLSGGILLVNAILCVILIPRFGLLGAAFANAVSTALMYLSALFIVKVKMKLWPYDRRYWKGIAAALLAAICGFAIRSSFGMSPPFSLAIQLVVVAGIFILSLYIFGLDREDRAFVDAITGRGTII